MGRFLEGVREAEVARSSGLFVAGTLGREGDGGPTVVDVGDEATSAKAAADRAGVIAAVPVAREMRLYLRRHPDGAGAVSDGERGAEGCQLRDGAEVAGDVVPATSSGPPKWR